MNNFSVVFRFEFLQQVRKKAFMVTTVILAIVLVFLVLSPVLFSSAFSGGNSDDSVIDGGVCYEDADYEGILPFEKDHVYDSAEDLEEAVKNGDEPVGYVIIDPTHIRTIYANYGISDETGVSPVEEMMKEIYVERALEARGVSSADYQKIQSEEISNEQVILGKDTTAQYVTGFIYVLIVYVVILLYGQLVSVAIAREKDSRTMELLITTTRADSLILGKVFAIIAVVLSVLALYIICAAVPYLLVHDRYPAVVKALLHGSLSPEMLSVYILFFVIGLVMYMFLFAALGSVVSRVEDVSSALAPVTLLIVISYFLSFVAMSGSSSPVLNGLSWVPFFSVLVMPIRFANATISAGGIAASAAVCVAFSAFLAYVSIRIYRWGTLNYGNKMSFIKVLRQVFRRDSGAAA